MQSFFERITRGPQERAGVEDVAGLDGHPSGQADPPEPAPPSGESGGTAAAANQRGGPALSPSSARLAVYDSLTSIPRVIDLSAPDCEEFIDLVAARTYQLAQERGGTVPFTVIREVIENLIHACFEETVITILDGGNTIRVADQGPGIGDPEKALRPGFSTATAEMKRVIKGVGSGLPIVKECLSIAGGELLVDSNLERGTVITLRMPASSPQASAAQTGAGDKGGAEAAPVPALSLRQKRALFLVTELGSAGPSRIARELRVALSTAYRDLTVLESHGLVACDESGKRALTSRGVQCLDRILEQ